MLERFILMALWVSSALFNLRNGPSMLLQEELTVLDEIMNVLKPIEQITRELCSEDVTCSKVLPLVNCLNAALQKKTPGSEIGIVLKMNLQEEMRLRFSNLAKAYPILAKATLLDPRFKKLHIAKLLMTAQTIRSVSLEMSTAAGQGDVQEDVQNEININQDNSEDLWSHHDFRALNNVALPDEPGGISAELRNFLSQGVSNRKIDPLKYWEESKHSFPSIYPVAVKYLSIPATSVPCERLFSKASIIDTNRRNKTNPERLSRFVFLSGIKEENWGF